MSRAVITVENLSKAYRIGLKEEIPDTLVSAMSGMMKAPFRKFRDLRKLDTFGHSGADEEDIYWALKDVSFEVQEGEVLGVIGRNGAGKSTLLKILSRITEPTSGRAVIRGRVSSLLEVGTGFHPELSGRENVYLNGTILGMMKREIDRKFDEIVDFSGIEKFLDTPIKRYSSGMKVRLAFAVAAHLEPEILIIDEVLAVGDAEFQKKCMGKMQDVARGGRTVLFVSHNMAAIQALCSHGLYLADGTVRTLGPVDTAVSVYLDGYGRLADTVASDRKDRGGTGEARVIDVYFADAEGKPLQDLICGVECKIVIQYSAPAPLKNPMFKATIYSRINHAVVHVNNFYDGSPPSTLADNGVAQCYLGRLPLTPGSYSINVSLSRDGIELDHLSNALAFQINSGDFYRVGRLPDYVPETCLIETRWEYGPTQVGNSSAVGVSPSS